MDEEEPTRSREWFVPKWGPRRFRLVVGLSFFPYTLMNASYVLIGSLLAPSVHFDRMAGMAAVYLLAVGISAHSLDATAPNRPWGDFMSRRQLFLLASAGLVPALALGVYYALTWALLLIPVGLAELFFLLSYNLEWFRGLFHTDFWFALSWGLLPVLAGYIVQSNSISVAALAGGLFGFSTAYVEISSSRPYKALRREGGSGSAALAARLESILKGVVAAVLAVAALLLAKAIFG